MRKKNDCRHIVCSQLGTDKSSEPSDVYKCGCVSVRKVMHKCSVQKRTVFNLVSHAQSIDSVKFNEIYTIHVRCSNPETVSIKLNKQLNLHKDFPIQPFISLIVSVSIYLFFYSYSSLSVRNNRCMLVCICEHCVCVCVSVRRLTFNRIANSFKTYVRTRNARFNQLSYSRREK